MKLLQEFIFAIKWRELLREITMMALIIGALQFLLPRSLVLGHSMEPNLREGERLAASPIPYLLLLRRAWFATERVAAGEWPRTELMGRELACKRLGLVGYGAIARVTARMARGLGMSVAACDPLLPKDDTAWREATRMSLPELLAGSDVVSLHVPLTDATRNMIDAAAIAGTKRGAILVNAARGGVVDEAALVAALRSGHLGGCGARRVRPRAATRPSAPCSPACLT